MNTRIVHFSFPSPDDVGQRCERSLDALTEIRSVMLDSYDIGPERRRLIAEQLRGVVLDLALAVGYLRGSVPQ